MKKMGVIIVIGIITLSTLVNFKKTEQVKEIHTLDVSGSGMVLVKSNEVCILIGGGTADYAESVYEYLKKQEVKKIDSVIWTNPTEDVTGAYKELIYKIPIEKLYINQVEKMDEFSKELSEALEGVRCQVETGFEAIQLKLKGGRVKSIALGDKQNSTKKAMLIEVQFKGLRYLWVAEDEGVKDVSDGQEKELKKLSPDILNLGRWEEQVTKDISEMRGIPTIKEYGEEIGAVIIDRREGEIIIYKGKRGYEMINKKTLKAKIL